MKNRIFSTLLVIMLALSVGLTGCGGVPAITEYTLTISSTEGGSVTTPGEGTGSFSFDEGTTVNLVAEADAGYHFVNWTGDVGTIAHADDTATSITMNDNCSITANFAYGPAIPLKNPGSFVQMTVEDVESLDPAWSFDVGSDEQLQRIYETLLSYDGEKMDQFVPVLATEWELLDDNVTYRFKIREGVKFHEGGDLTPSDVEYSFERAMVQDRYAGPGSLLLRPLLGVYEASPVTFADIDNAVEVDGDWVVFHLYDRSWDLAFLQFLCGPWTSMIVDKEWCIANGEWDGTEETWLDHNNPDKTDSYLYNHTNGTGPWKLEQWDPSVQVTLVRNDDYWRDPAPFERVITQIVEEWTTRKEALLDGDADFVYVPRDRVGELEGIAGLDAYQDLPELLIDAFFFNFGVCSESEFIGSGALDGNGIPTDFFTDIDVRKGFNYAFDWDTYIDDAHMGEAEQCGSPIIEGILFYNPDASMYSLDLTKAEEHLRAAWGGEVWEKGVKFTLVYNLGNLARETACKILAENLQAINPKFQVSILPVDWNTVYGPNLHARCLPMFQIGWWPDYPHPNDFVVPFMKEGMGGVFSYFQGYGSAELNEAIAAAFQETDPVQQQAKYYQLQERYYEDAPSIMLVQRLGRRYFTKYIHGFYFNPMIPGRAGPLYYMSKSES